MSKLDSLLEKLTHSEQLEDLIGCVENSECDRNSSVILEHKDCFISKDGLNLVARCYRAILALVVQCISSKPEFLTDCIKGKLCEKLKEGSIKVEGLVSLDILRSLSTGPGSQIMIWIKYESLLIQLIKEYVYEPKTMANEVLELAKIELDPKLAAKFAPILGPCAKVCREVNRTFAEDEEVEEKWCEIIDWMGWFMSGDDDM